MTPVGRLHHLAPVLRLSETAPRWARPTVPLGYHPPAWPERAGTPTATCASRPARIAAVVLATVLFVSPALAHNNPVHQDMTVLTSA